MLRILKIIVMISAGMCCFGSLHAQAGKDKQPVKEKPAIRVLARATADRILLRWAVTTPAAWKFTNGYGFEITRFTIMRDGKTLPVVTRKVLNATPIKPAPLERWEQIVQHDSYAAVIAQALYGKDFEVSGKTDKSIASMISQTNEITQRYAMSLYAADNSFAAAKMAGWAWEDTTAVQNEKYLYRIRTLGPVTTMRVDSSGALIGLKDYQPLPVPAVPAFISGNKSVLLSWRQQIVSSDYTSWYVEKSADNGLNYTKTTGLPVTNINQKDNKASTTWLTDSLKDNNTTYLYRLRGVTPFGETGPPSLPVKVKGQELLEYVPHIRRNEIDEKGGMTMTWEFDQQGNDKIKGFALNQAEKEAGPYKVVMENIPADSRELKYDKLFPTNYFTITAVAKEGKSSLSFPVLVQPVDSTPPAAPVGVQAVIDSAGKVTITWERNKETDMLGYKVFRAHVGGHEMSPITDTVIFANSFKDSVVIKSLNSKVYYAVTAFDKRYNQSAFSQVITVKKPDVVPPSSPVFAAYKVIDNSVKLNWIASQDDDVAAHVLYRRNMADSGVRWQELKVLGIKADYYQDIAVEPGRSYSYIIIARDSSGLESTAVKPLLVSIPPKPEAAKVKSFNATVYRDKFYLEIFWKDNLDIAAVQEYQLYKAPVGTPISLWKVMKAGSRQTVDEELVVNTEYQYGIRAVMKDGTIGQLTTIRVSY